MSSAHTKMPQVQEIFREAAARLQRAGVETPVLDAQLMMAGALECSRLDIVAHPERKLTTQELSAFDAMLARRVAREPLAYILGYREFRSLEITVTSDVLVPRPETEILVEEVVRRIQRKSPIIAEVGVGSGAVSIALAVELPNATVYATEISDAAAKVAQANAEKHGMSDKVKVLLGDILQPVSGMTFDAVVSNPPYIPSAVVDTLEPEVRDYEPREALDGGADGLNAYRRLFTESLNVLRSDGFVAVEVGMGQAEAVREISASIGFGCVEIIKDLSGIERVVVAYR